MKKVLLLLPILLLLGCAPTFVQNAYVSPSGGCGYRVILGGERGADIAISRCLPLEEATKLAGKINEDMGNRWYYAPPTSRN